MSTRYGGVRRGSAGAYGRPKPVPKYAKPAPKIDWLQTMAGAGLLLICLYLSALVMLAVAP